MKKLYYLLFCLPLFLEAQTFDSLSVVKGVDSLVQESRKLAEAKQYEGALNLLGFAKNKAQEAFGQEHPLFANCLHNCGRVYQLMGKLSESEQPYLQAKVIREKTLGKDNLEYVQTIYNLARLYGRMGKTKEAEPLYLETAAIREKILGGEHPEYISDLAELADLYIRMAKYEEAEALLLKSKALREKVLGKEHLDYVSSLNSQANLCRRIAKYEQAEPLILEALDLIQKIEGKTHVYANTLNNLANLYWEMGDYEKAVDMHLEAKGVREKVVGKAHPDYAQTLNNIANLYLNMGKYDLAEPMLLESKSIREQYYGKGHAEYARATMGLAYLYLLTANYEQAESYYLETKTIREKTLGKENTDYASTLNGLALLYVYTKRYEAAEQLYAEIKTIYEKKLNKDHPYLARNRNNLADLFIRKGDYKQAEALLLEAKAIREKKSGKEHPEYAVCLSNLAIVYRKMGEYPKSEQFCVEAMKLREKLLGKENPNYRDDLENLAKLNLEMGRYGVADTLFANLIQLNHQLVTKGMSHLSENELANYTQLYSDQSNQFYSFVGERQGLNPALNALAWNNEMFSKGLLLENARALEKAVSTASDSLRKMHGTWKNLLRRLAVEYAKTDEVHQNVADMEAQADVLEKKLVRSVAGFAEVHRHWNWRDVQAKLRPDEAAVEFVHYRYFDHHGEATDTILYAALVLTQSSFWPRWVPLCSQKQFDDLTGAKKYTVDFANQYYATGSALYGLVWQHIEPLLTADKAQTPIKTIYLAPSGILHRVNFDAIAIRPGMMLADRYQLVLTGSTRRLVGPAGKLATNNDAALFGGIRYDADTTASSPTFSTLTPVDGDLALRGTDAFADPLKGNAWRYLPFTEREVDNIERILAKNKLKPIVRRGMGATEESFKRIGQNGASPRVLHVATHGFSFPDPKYSAIDKQKLVFKNSNNPMIRTGLVFAGGNMVWKGGMPLANKEDGILTAYEIGQMNLSNTEIVILSACETGLGDIQGNEGVYGLQRAFKIAGAKYVILSLWQIPDKQTSQLMTTFYQNWLEKKMSIPAAFRLAQKQMRDLGLEPYKWAGFVLVE